MNALVTALAGVLLAGSFSAAYTSTERVSQRNTTDSGSTDISTQTTNVQSGYWKLLEEGLVNSRGKDNLAKTRNAIGILPGFYPLKTLLPITTSVRRRLPTLADLTRAPKTRNRRNLAHVIRTIVPSRAIKHSHQLKAEKGRVREGYIRNGPRPALYRGKRPGGTKDNKSVKSRLAPTRRNDDSNKNYVYYEIEGKDPRNSVTEQHLTIVEVPKGANGVIPLKNVHVVAPGPQGQANAGSSLLPSVKKPLDSIPYVITKKSDSRSEQPLLVLPYEHDHSKHHGLTNAILPLQKAPPIIRGIKESFNELRGAHSPIHPYSAQPDSRNFFGPPKGEDVVTMQSIELSGAKNPPNQRPHFSSYNSEGLSHRPSPTGVSYYNAQRIPQHGTSAMVIKGMAPPGQPPNAIRRPPINHNADTPRPNENPPSETPNTKHWPNLGSATRAHKWFKHTPNHVHGPLLRTPDVRLVYTRNQPYHSSQKETRTPATGSRGGGIVTNLQKQISKGIRNFPVWIDEILGSESSPPRQYAQTQPLHHSHHTQFGQRPRVKTHRERPRFHVTGVPSNRFHPNENSLFFNRLPTPYSDGASNSQQHRGASVQKLTPVSIAKTKFNSAAPPNTFIREGPKGAPYFFNAPSIQIHTQGVPPPSHRGSPAVNSLNLQGVHYRIASSPKFQPLINIKHRDRDIPPQTNPAREEDNKEEVDEYVGPPLVMFTLDDAISLDSTRNAGLTQNKKAQLDDSLVPVSNGFYQTQSRQPNKQEKYYVVEIQGKPSADRVKNLISSGARTKNGLAFYNGSFASSEDNHPALSTIAPIPTQTEPTTYFHLPTAPIPPTVTEPSNEKNDPSKPKLVSLFNFNKSKTNSDNFAHSSDLRPKWKTLDERNINGTKTSLSISVKKVTDNVEKSDGTESANKTAELEKNKHPNKTTPSVDFLPGRSKLKPLFRRINSTNWHFTRTSKPSLVTSVKNNSKWSQGFTKQNEKKEKRIESKPFGFQLWRRTKMQTNATLKSKEAKLRTRDFSQTFVRNWGSKNEEEGMLVSASKKYPVEVQLISEDKAIREKQIPAEFIYKWPKYIRPPPSVNNETDFETIISSVNDSTLQNSNDATLLPRNRKESQLDVDGNDCFEEENEQPSMVLQDEQIQEQFLDTKKSTSPFLKFQKLVQSRKAEKEAEDRNKEHVLWKTVKDTSESRSTTQSPNLHPLTTQTTISTTFRKSADGSSSNSKPLRFLSMLRNRARDRKRKLDAEPTIPKERGGSTTPRRNLQRRRRRQRASAARLKELSTTTIWPETMKESQEEPTAERSKLNKRIESLERIERKDKQWSSGERFTFSWGGREEIPRQPLQQVSRTPNPPLLQKTPLFSAAGRIRQERENIGDTSHKSTSMSFAQSPTYTNIKVVTNE